MGSDENDDFANEFAGPIADTVSGKKRKHEIVAEAVGGLANVYGGIFVGAALKGLVERLLEKALEQTQPFLAAGRALNEQRRRDQELAEVLLSAMDPLFAEMHRLLEGHEKARSETLVQLSRQTDDFVDRLLRCGKGLATQAGQATIAELLHEVLARPVPVTPEPPLYKLVRQWRIGGDPFQPECEKTGFVGRASELEALHRFAAAKTDATPNLLWWLWTGPGGQGKSRLAQRWCSQLKEQGWACHSWPAGNQFAAWSDWVVHTRSVLIIDEVAARAADVRRALEALAVSKQLWAPLRVLLLERPFADNDAWPREFMPGTYGDAAADLLEHAYRAPGATSYRLSALARALGPLDDRSLNLLVSEILVARGRIDLDVREIVDTITTIDPGRRPLFAVLATEAMAAGADNLWKWDRHSISDFVLDREFNRWRSSLGPAQHWTVEQKTAFEQHLNLSTLATVAGPQPTSRNSSALVLLQEFGVPLPQRILPDWLRTLAGYGHEPDQEDEDEVAPFKPDVLGELFVLERLQGRYGADSNPAVPRTHTMRTLEVGLADAPSATLTFLSRCITDFPTHPALSKIAALRPPEGESANYGFFIDHSVHMSHLASVFDAAALTAHAIDCDSRLLEWGQVLEQRADNAVFATSLNQRLALVHYNRSVHRRLGDVPGAIEDCTQCIDRLAGAVHSGPPRSSEDYAAADIELRARLLRALLYENSELGDPAPDLSTIIEHELAGPNLVAEARIALARALVKRSQRDRAIELYEEALAVATELGAPARVIELQATRELRNVLWDDAIAIERASRSPESACARYTRFIELVLDDPTLLAMGLVNRAGALRTAQCFSEAASDCTRVIELPAAPPEQVARARLLRAEARLKLRRLLEAGEDVAAVLASPVLPELDSDARVLEACIAIELGSKCTAITQLEALLADERATPRAKSNAMRVLGFLAGS